MKKAKVSTKSETARIKKQLSGALGKRLNAEFAAANKISTPVRVKDGEKALGKLLGGKLIDAATRRESNRLLAENAAKKEQLATKMLAEATKISTSHQRVLKAQMAEHIKLVQAVPLDAPTDEVYLLGKPFMILPSAGARLDDFAFIDVNSWAKIKTTSDGTRQDYVRFYFIWTNPHNTYAVVNLEGFIIFNGYVGVGTNGGLFADCSSYAYVNGTLEIYEWWNNPPTQPVPQPDQSVQAVNLGVTSSGIFDVGAIDGRSIFRGYGLQYVEKVVRPNGTLVFAVTATLTHSNNDGSSTIDFTSKNFSIGAPCVIVRVVS